MISERFSSYIYYIMMALLLLNITQRKHIKHGEKKRLATLWMAGLFLFLQVELVVIQHYKLSDYYIIPAFLVFLVIGYLLRKKMLVFKFKCESCGTKLDYKRVLYWDSNKCEKCDPPEEPSAEETEETAPALETEEDFRKLDSVEEVDWDAWEPSETAVICYIIKEGKVLLINKKTGLGKGKVNAPGGRIEAGEMPIEAAVRETEEETGLTPIDPVQMGTLSFIFRNGYSLKGFVFFAKDFTGEMRETEEADPFWVKIEEIPFDKMWEDDSHWLPEALKGKKFNGRFIFDEDVMVSKAIDFEKV